MKILITLALTLIILLFGTAGSVEARSVRVRGYTKSNGTYVAPYYRTSPNKTKWDNYSTEGNHNPYTGKTGKASPWKW